MVDAGQVCGEDRFLGLFTSTAYNLSPREIPLLRRKVEQVAANVRGFTTETQRHRVEQI